MVSLSGRFHLPSGMWVLVREGAEPGLVAGGMWQVDTQYGHHFRVEGTGAVATGRTREELLRDAFKCVERELVSREVKPGVECHVLAMGPDPEI